MDLAALKIDAIIERREKKDYMDLYFLFKSLGARKVLEEFKIYNPHVSDKSVWFALGEVPAARSCHYPVDLMAKEVVSSCYNGVE